MNIQQIQFNRQKMVALLLAGLMLAAGLLWIRMNISLANQETDSVKADAVNYDSRLSPELQLRSVEGGKGGMTGEW